MPARLLRRCFPTALKFKTKSQIEEMVAEIAPKPVVPPKIRKLPEPREKAKSTPPPLLGPDQVVPPVIPSNVRPAVVQPLAPTRYKMQFTASAELHDKLKRLQALMRSDNSPANIRLMCKAHNGYLAERDYGRELMTQYRRSPSRVSEPLPIYSTGIRSEPLRFLSSRRG